ncbi:hypothetical protein BCR36DRAFT_582922 [Piromyces finnis]|uniref:G-protein coupled receptors family 3 profile domain-containing protein n=1 Tax=Piromyces finnis TaxID=1754191 RepID=A0A1Y1VAJ0_9FUNG|nr:hypothetical protein BCR36DRAFT_582922 [Piromyces finnis]|eukprot:ORX51373.1 hypothetical protein BCR36DRAFT_582922 [Piromyces finnis]
MYDGSGMIICVSGYSQVNIQNIIGENIKCERKVHCSVIAMENSSKVDIFDLTLNNVFSFADDGLIFFIHKPTTDSSTNHGIEIGSKCIINNLKLKNITQSSDKIGSMFWLEGGVLSISNLNMSNVEGNYSGLIFDTNAKNDKIIVKNSIFENIHIQYTDGIFNTLNSKVEFLNVTLSNTKFVGPLFHIGEEKVTIENSKFSNINSCDSLEREACNKSKKNTKQNINNVLFYSYNSGSLIITNSTISDIYEYSLFHFEKIYKIDFYDVAIENSYFENGLIHMNYENNKNYNNFKIFIGDSVIRNIYSPNSGAIINNLNSNKYEIIVNDTLIENNRSDNYGGVIYLTHEEPGSAIAFNNCTFIDNKGVLGNICFAKSLLSEPYFSNKEELISTYGDGMFTTNPTHIRMKNTDININVLSGEQISNEISLYLYDDYNNLIDMGSNIDNLILDDLVFYTLEMNDTSNTKFIGQTTNYCFKNECVLPGFRIIGNPGDYILNVKISHFGKFTKFQNNTYPLKIKIKECNNLEYKYGYRESSYLKTCYQPVCEPKCNTGKCVSDNYCNCENTGFTGKACNEYFKLERMKSYNIIIMIITSILVILSLYIMVKVLLYRNDLVIKEGGGKNFLLIILIGTLLNYIYIMLITVNRSHIKCLFLDVTKQLGFSLVFGTITIKSLRIYYAISTRLNKKRIKTDTMYFLILLIIILHLILIFVYEIFNEYKIVIELTSDNKEYMKCKKSKKTFTSKVINLVILSAGSFLTYSIRNLKSEFKEDMTLTIYIYIIIEILLIIIDYQNVSPITIDLFNTIGPLLYSATSLYDIFYSKFQIIRKRDRKELKLQKANERRKLYRVQRLFDDYQSFF